MLSPVPPSSGSGTVIETSAVTVYPASRARTVAAADPDIQLIRANTEISRGKERRLMRRLTSSCGVVGPGIHFRRLVSRIHHSKRGGLYL